MGVAITFKGCSRFSVVLGMTAREFRDDILAGVSLVHLVVQHRGIYVKPASNCPTTNLTTENRNQTTSPQVGGITLGDYWFKWGTLSSLTTPNSRATPITQTEGMF